jgi:hypothetical protein
MRADDGYGDGAPDVTVVPLINDRIDHSVG